MKIESCSSPVFRTGGSSATGQDRSGTTTLDDLVIVRKLDTSSPKLAQHTCDETVSREVPVEMLTDSDSEASRPYSITPKNAMFSGYNIHATSEGRHTTTEKVILNPETIHWDKPDYNHDGSAGEKGTVLYAPGTNKSAK